MLSRLHFSNKWYVGLFSLALLCALILVPSLAYGMDKQEKTHTYEQAEALFQQKNYAGAMKLYDKILDEDPLYANAIGGKAAIFHRQGDYYAALQHYDAAIAINSTNPHFLSDRGNLLLALGDDVKAEKNLKNALVIFPDFVDALNGLANVYSYRHDYDNEMLYRLSVLVVEPDNLEAMIGIANIHNDLGQYDAALEQYDKVLGMNKNSVNALIGKGNVYVKLNKYQHAIKQYDKALSLDTNNANALKGNSLAYLKLGEYKKSVELDKLTKNMPDAVDDSKNVMIPFWIKNMFGWYAQGKISDNDLVNSLKYMIKNKIILLE